MAKISNRLLDKYRYAQVEHWTWWSNVYEAWVEKLNELGYEVTKDTLSFSGFSSQGDGASFTCRINWPKWLHNHPGVRFHFVDMCTKVYRAKVYRSSRSPYVHENTTCVEMEFHDEAYQVFDDSDMDKLVTAVENEARGQMRELYRALEEEHDWLTSDECVTQYIEMFELDEE